MLEHIQSLPGRKCEYSNTSTCLIVKRSHSKKIQSNKVWIGESSISTLDFWSSSLGMWNRLMILSLASIAGTDNRQLNLAVCVCVCPQPGAATFWPHSVWGNEWLHIYFDRLWSGNHTHMHAKEMGKPGCVPITGEPAFQYQHFWMLFLFLSNVNQWWWVPENPTKTQSAWNDHTSCLKAQVSKIKGKNSLITGCDRFWIQFKSKLCPPVEPSTDINIAQNGRLSLWMIHHGAN